MSVNKLHSEQTINQTKKQNKLNKNSSETFDEDF